jgi:hypothetical protein
MPKRIFLLTSSILLSLLIIANTAFGEVLFKDDFNGYTGNPNGRGWNADNMWNTAEVVADAGPDGSNALRIAFDRDQLNRWCNWRPSRNVQEFYIKFDFKIDCGSGTCAGGAKFLKIFGKDGVNSSYANTTTAFDYAYPSPLFTGLSYGADGKQRDTSSVLGYNGSKKIQGGGVTPKIESFGDGEVDPRDGKWHTWELHMKYNDDDQDNGIYQVWYDGQLILRATGVNNRSSYSPKFVKEIQLGGWNQNYGGAPYHIYYDNVVISTTRIE